jgi:UDP-N-acetylglucosamine acyltransferase
MSARMIDPSARIEAGATIGKDVSIGPYCTVGAHVSIGDGCRLLAHVNLTGHTTIGRRTVIHPFASLGSPPQSVSYRGGPTKLVIGAECDIRENVTMNTGTEDDRGVTEVGDRCFFMVGSHVAHDCKVGNNVVFANNILLGGHVTIGDNVVFGGGVGMRRRGVAKADIQRVRLAYQSLFFGEGAFRARVERVASEYGADPLVSKIIEFIRAGKRPLTMAIKRNDADAEA